MSRRFEPLRPLAGSITVEVEGDRRVLCLQGDIDSAVVARFTAEYAPELPLIDVIDAGDVSFLSSTGLAVMLRCSQAAVAAGGERPVLRSESPAVRYLLKQSGLDSALRRQPPTPGGPPDVP